MNAEKQERLGKLMVPVMAIFALGASQGGVNAGMATMGAAFPDAGPNIAYVVSIVALGMIPSGIVSGAVTGKYIKYRTSIIAAIILYIVSGCWPFIASGTSFGALLVSRFVFGFAVGWSYPLAQALVFKSVADENKRASWLGVGMCCFNLGSMIMEFAGGYLAVISWQACFLVYLIGLIPLLIVIFMLREPETDAQQAEELAKTTGQVVKAKIPPITFCYMLMLTLVTGFAMPTILYCSFVIADPIISGWILSAMTLVGAFSGLTLGPVYKRIGKWTLPVSILVLGILYTVSAMVSQPDSFNLAIYATAFLAGHWGFAVIIPGTGDMVTNLTPIAAATRAMGFNTAFHQLGCFIGTPVAAIMLSLMGGSSVIDVLLPTAIAIIVLGIIDLILVSCTKMEKYGDAYGKADVEKQGETDRSVVTGNIESSL